MLTLAAASSFRPAPASLKLVWAPGTDEGLRRDAYNRANYGFGFSGWSVFECFLKLLWSQPCLFLLLLPKPLLPPLPAGT